MINHISYNKEEIKMSIFNQRIKQGIDSYKEDLKTKDGNVHMLLIETIVDLGEKQKKRIYFKNK